MKNLFCYAFLIFFFLPAKAGSQNIHPSGCSDFFIHQTDSIKQVFAKQGFIVVKEASMNMESENEMPVIVPLTQGSLYQFVFIGDISSNLYEVRMFDWDEKQVAYQKKQLGDADGNIISYSYIPKISEYHMMKPVQVNKQKEKLCGYIMLLKKVDQ